MVVRPWKRWDGQSLSAPPTTLMATSPGRGLHLGAQVFHQLPASWRSYPLDGTDGYPGVRLALLPGARTRGYLAWFSGRGGDPEGHLVLSRRDLLSNLSGVLEADGLTHLLYLTPCLVHLLGGPHRRTHFGSIRGTPCSTAATVAPGHGPGGSCFSCCRGYGQRVGQSGYPAPCLLCPRLARAK